MNILKPAPIVPVSGEQLQKPNPFLDNTKTKPNPFLDSPNEYFGFFSNDSPLDVMRTPGGASGTGSAFSPVKPSPVMIRGWDTPVTPKSDKENSTSILPPPANIGDKDILLPSVDKVKSSFGERTAKLREQVRKNVPKPTMNSTKVKETLEEKKASLKKNMGQVKKNVPRTMNPLNRAPQMHSVDLADLSLATVCLVPRLGCGMSSGRMPFERMRTSLMLHLMQEMKMKTWTKTEGQDLISKLSNTLHDCISNGEVTFVDKAQEIVKLSRETVEVRTACLYFSLLQCCLLASKHIVLNLTCVL